jgi:hypothetical protein
MASDTASTQNPFGSSGGTVLPPNFSLTPIQTATTATAFTVRPNQSGTCFILPAVGAAITLPAPASCVGCNWRFTMSANNATTAWEIGVTGGVSVITGSLYSGATTAGVNNVVQKAAAANCSFTTTALAGDTIDVVSNGVTFFIRGTGGAAASFI